MFIKQGRSWYTSSGEQRARGPFLLVASSDENKGSGYVPGGLRAWVRHVELRQAGHWMAGDLTLHTADRKEHRVYLSGSLGGDGLPKSLPHDVWETGIPIPYDLVCVLANDDGWNRVGWAGGPLLEWARANHVALSRAGSKPAKRRPFPDRPPKTAPMRERFRVEYQRRRILRGRGLHLSDVALRNAVGYLEPWRGWGKRNPHTKTVRWVNGVCVHHYRQVVEPLLLCTSEWNVTVFLRMYRRGETHPHFREWVKRDLTHHKTHLTSESWRRIATLKLPA